MLRVLAHSNTLNTVSPSRFLSQFPQFTASFRSTGQSGSRKSQKLRKEGQIPGVLYGIDDDRNVLKMMLTVDQKALKTELQMRGKSFENTVYELLVNGPQGTVKYLVTPRQVQHCSVTFEPLSVNFLRYLPGNKLKIPIVYENADKSDDLKRGSFIFRVNQYIDCVCEENVPESIKIDLSSATKTSVFRLSSLQFPPKVRPAKSVPPDFVAAVVKSSKS